MRVEINGDRVIGKRVTEAIALQDDMELVRVADAIYGGRIRVASELGYQVPNGKRKTGSSFLNDYRGYARYIIIRQAIGRREEVTTSGVQKAMEQENKPLRTSLIVGVALFAPCGIGILYLAQLHPEMGRLMHNYFEHVAVLLAAIMELSIIRQLFFDINKSLYWSQLLKKAGPFDPHSLESITNCYLGLSSNLENKTIVARLRMIKIGNVALGTISYSQGLIFGMGLIQHHTRNGTVLSEIFVISFLAFLLLTILGLCFITEGLKDDMLESAFERLIPTSY